MLLIISVSFPHVSHAIFLSPSLLQLSVFLFQNVSKYPTWILHKHFFLQFLFLNAINYSFFTSCFFYSLLLSLLQLFLSLLQNISKYPIWILHKIFFSYNIQFLNTINYSSFISSCFLILSPIPFVYYTSLSSSFADRAEEVPLLTQTPPGVVHEGGVAGEETQEEEQGK